MKISIGDLKSYGLYDGLPDKLKQLKSGQYYCFYYSPDYDNSKIVIVKDFVAVDLNISLYRDVFNVIKQANTSDIFLGCFTPNLETRDGLFYLMLNTFCNEQSVIDFYAYASERDTANELRISNLANVEIMSRESFSDALAYFMHPDKLNTVLSIYDIVNDYTVNNHNTSLYGGIIKKVVQLIKSDNGVMSEDNGSLRFMVVGEKANLSESEREKLKLAKSLLRSLNNPNDIYTKTGWFYNTNDGLWRTNISDKESSLDESLVVKVNDNLKVYKPLYSPVSQEQIVANLRNPDSLINQGYNGKLSEILKHRLLYQYYPELADLALIYAENKSNTYYYSDKGEGVGFINIQGDKSENNLLSILLHETQHAIQHIEGFATGGNSHFADFVIALGGKGVRSIFASIFNFQRFISTTVNNEAIYNELRNAIQDIKASSPNSNQLKSKILNDFMVSYEAFRESSNSVAFYLMYLITDVRVFNEGEIIDFLQNYYGDEIFDLFEEIKDAIDSADRATQKLLDESYTKEDVRIINFNTYQNLLGEMEARGTQHQMRIPVNLSNYFFLNEWEKSPTKSIAVIGGNYIMRDTSKIVGACEKALDGRYVLHFNKGISCIPYIHELGHIVHDILSEDGFEQVIRSEYDKEVIADDYQEYFVNVFMGYIAENYNDSLIGKDLAMDFSIKQNKVIFDILGNVFNPKPQDIDIVKGYLTELEESIGG